MSHVGADHKRGMILSCREIFADFLPFAVFLPEGCTTFAAEFGSGERDVGASYGILAVGCCLAEGGDALYSNDKRLVDYQIL